MNVKKLHIANEENQIRQYVINNKPNHDKWINTIHGSKYWNVKFNNGLYGEFRYSNHMSNGNPLCVYDEEFTQVGNDIYVLIGKEFEDGGNIYSKILKNQKVIVKIINENIDIIIDFIRDRIGFDIFIDKMKRV